ncbi:dockerin type I domain-containing protein [[Clostridium] fimetarium]|uniref:dockerin type I domain-containing protein n=1 Tax=[Clostridium] fimetarium TaxID=99656 RepID=UPI00147FD564
MKIDSIQKYISGISILTNIELSAADVTGDKEVSFFDILEMQRYILGITDF